MTRTTRTTRMDAATNDAARDEQYERHQALSAILRALQPQDPGV